MHKWLDRKLYPEYEDGWDNSYFREVILRVIHPEYQLLDLGAGAGIVPQMNFRGKVARVCGIDLDPRILENKYLDEAKISSAEEIPYPSGAFDVVISNNVMEHLEHPAKVLEEAARVLKPMGVFLLKTPNKWHYVTIIARITPNICHVFVNRLRGRKEGHTFPTYYFLNTPGKIRKYATEAGFNMTDLQLVEGRPEYLRKSAPAYLLGWFYEKIVNSTEFLSGFRVVLIAALRKGGTCSE
jgi:2-polyprenyl-3-methyl-5-hydroxy-6-metoxy-1,4-benzoquinol methylase